MAYWMIREEKCTSVTACSSGVSPMHSRMFGAIRGRAIWVEVMDSSLVDSVRWKISPMGRPPPAEAGLRALVASPPPRGALTDAHNQFFRALFDTAFDATIVVDEQGEIVIANAACEPLFGYSPAELFGRSVETLVPHRFQAHAELRGRFLGSPHARSMGQGMPLYARHALGHDVPVDIALNPVTLGSRRWTSAVILLGDDPKACRTTGCGGVGVAVGRSG